MIEPPPPGWFVLLAYRVAIALMLLLLIVGVARIF
jgi:hypothetical protein